MLRRIVLDDFAAVEFGGMPCVSEIRRDLTYVWEAQYTIDTVLVREEREGGGARKLLLVVED